MELPGDRKEALMLYSVVQYLKGLKGLGESVEGVISKVNCI